MPFELVTTAPKSEDFIPLSEHQEQTPTTFFGSRPVLHHHSPEARLSVRRSEYEAHDVLRQIRTSTGDDPDDVILVVDVWVTSKNVVLFSPITSKGVSIDYPSIALHALGSQAGQTTVYLQLDLHDQDLTNDDEDIQTLTMNIIPKATVESSTAGETTNGHAESEATNGATTSANSEAAKALFEALSACADLNPDPMDEDEDGEGGNDIQMPEPGAGGWITSENMHEFMDAEGNWTGPQIPVLGAGAGQVHSREDDEEGDTAEGADETKWQRTG